MREREKKTERQRYKHTERHRETEGKMGGLKYGSVGSVLA